MNLSKVKITYNVILFIVLIFLIIIFGLMLPNGIFFKPSVLLNTVPDVAYLGIMALAMTFVILTGGIDLSVGHIMIISAMSFSVVFEMTSNTLLSTVLCIISGCVCGYINGIIIAKTKIPPLIVTLSTMSVFQGITWFVGGSHTLTAENVISTIGSGKVFNLIPNQLLVLFVMFFIFDITQKKTVVGRLLSGLGYNEETITFSGISEQTIKTLVYVCSGALCSIAGLMFISRGYEINTTTAINLNLEVITLVVLGGTSTSGGIGSIRGTLMATLVIGILRKGLSFLGYSGDVYNFILGAVLVVSLIFLAYLQERSKIATMKQEEKQIEDLG
ncbi:MAG: ABC transporter permease [Brevinema sp.]